MTEEEYFMNRLADQLKWYDKKNAINKKYNYLFKILIIVASALIPFFAGMLDDASFMKYLVSFLGVFVAVLTGV